MKKIFVLLFTSLLITSMFFGCGGSSSGDDNKNDGGTTKVNIPGSNAQVDTKTKKPSSKTGTSTNSGCQEDNIPGCIPSK